MEQAYKIILHPSIRQSPQTMSVDQSLFVITMMAPLGKLVP